jgi:SAM-dependent methyltransferase
LKDPHAIHPNYYSVSFCFKALRDELGLLFMFVFIFLAFGWFFLLLNWRNGIIEHLPAKRPPPSYENADVSVEWKQKVDALTTVGTTEISKEVKTWMKLVDPSKFTHYDFEQGKKSANSDERAGNTNSSNSDKSVGNPTSDNPEPAALALELLKSRLCDGKRKQMLDAGSGSGYFTILLEIAADSCKFRPRTIAIGIDKEPRWVGQSMKNAVASGSKGVAKLVEEKHVRFIEGDVTKRETFTKEALTQALPYSSEPERMFDLIHVGFVATEKEKAALTKLLDTNGLMFVATAGGNSSGGAGSISSQFSVVRDDGSEKGTHTIVKRLRGSEEDTHA